MPRKKRLSDDVYNARRRAKRLAARLTKDFELDKSVSVEARKDLQKFSRELRKNIEKSYFSKSDYASKKPEISDNLKRLKAYSRESVRTRNDRINMLFQWNMSKMPDYKAKIFYRATQKMWQGHSVTDRNIIIMQKMGTNDLREAFNIIMKQNQKALEHAKAIREPIGVTNENADFYEDMYGDTDNDDDKGSPEYLYDVIFA